MTLFETVSQIGRPAGSVIKMIIEKAKVKTWDYSGGAIECDADDRLFVVPYHNSDHLVESYLEYECGYASMDPADTESIELSDVIADKEFLEAEFFRHILEAEEL